jgi:Zn-dependent protease
LIVLLYLPAIVELLPGVRSGTALALGVIFAILLAASVLLHELGHCVVALRFGLPVRRVRLFLLGGVTEITRPPERPRDEGLVAIAGPIVSMVLAVVGGLWWLSARPETAMWLIAAQIAVANVAVAVFNMLPGLPLDGGRALRALVWALSGRREIGTMSGVIGAGLVGVALAWWAVYGLLVGVSGGWTRAVVATAMIAFIALGARAELASERAQRLPLGLSLPRLVRPVLELPAETPLASALAAAPGYGIVLVSSTGTAVGLLDERLAMEVVAARPGGVAAEAAEPIRPESVLLESEPISDVVHRVRETPAWQFLVVDEEGRPTGVLRRDDLRAAVARERMR